MNIFFSGDHEKCNHYLHLIKSIAARFSTFCNSIKVDYNFLHFEIETVQADISFIYGDIAVHIYAPPTNPAIPIEETKEIIKILPIWVKHFDEEVIGSFGGMFYGLSSIMLLQYSPSALQKNTIEIDITNSTEAELCCSYSYRESLAIRYVFYGISLSNTVAAVEYSHDGNYYHTYTSLEDDVLTGLKASAFTANGDGYVRYTLGGDQQYPELEAESSGSFAAPGIGDPIYIYDVAWDFLYSLPAWAALPSTAEIVWPFDSWFGGPYFASTLWSGFKGIMSKYIHATIAASDLTFEMSDPVWDGYPVHFPNNDGYEYWYNSTSLTTGVVTILITQICTDGTLSTCTIVLYDSVNAITRFTSDVSVAQMTEVVSADRKNVYYWHHTGPYVPDTFYAAPRNYISLQAVIAYIGTKVSSAFAYDDSTGVWKDCNFLQDNPVLWSDDCCTYVGIAGDYSGGTYWTDFNVYKRMFSVENNRFDYVSILSYKTVDRITSTLMFGYLPVHTILYPCGTVLSVYGASDTDKNGIYRLSSSSASKIHTYAANEIEPVFVSHDGTVVVTKTKIYLPNQTVVCTECCGIYLDYTHYVDRISSAMFAIVRISDGAIVDTTIDGLYNFYEFSEDTSVCILSKYVKYISDSNATGPAIVLDYADKVYRFEPSDVPIVHQLNENTFQGTEENNVYGYPEAIPYGARYRGVCNCECWDADINIVGRQHYIYCTPPGGFTYHLPAPQVGCVLCNRYKTGGGGNNPTRLTDEEIRLNRTIVPQYPDADRKRSNTAYDEVRLNKYIYHHVGKVLRRRDPGLTAISEYETTFIGVQHGNRT